MNDGVNVEVDNGIAIATMSNPGRMNALTPQILADLEAFWRRFRRDDTLRVAILTGEGDSFSSGHDMKWLAEQFAAEKAGAPSRTFDEELAALGVRGGHRHVVTQVSSEIDKPVIAAVSGACLGFGLMLAAHSDLRLCSANATFGMPQVKRGFKVILPHLLFQRGIPAAVALDMGMTGDPIGAEEALRWGLVSRVFETPAALREGAIAVARAIADNPPDVIQSLKRAYMLGLLQLPTNLAQPIWDNLMEGRHSLRNEETRNRITSWTEGRG
jgi:E-phenylitaconyl-CoA hydratase